MTSYPFKVGNADFSDMVYKRGYKTVAIPVYSRSVTTLDGKRHRKKLRERWRLVVYINAPTAVRAAELCTALLEAPQITYCRLQTGETASEPMELDDLSLNVLLKAADGTQWFDGFELTLTGM